MLRLLNRIGLASTILAVVVIASASFAQDDRGGGRGDRGGPGRGGSDAGGGFPGGGFRGGPPGGGFPGGGTPGGGPPGGGFPGGGTRGGPPGGTGGFSPADMLRRFDENGNGMIDPAESQGRAGFFLQRIASEVPGIDLSKPVPIEKLAQAMERMRTQRDSGGGNDNSPSSSGRPASTTIEPLVPGFGVEDLLPPVLGFGAGAELFTIKITDADKREAEERLRRYDTNRDGVLDKSELARGRWTEDPLTYDRNHDGKLTVSELAVRYAQRRVAEAASRVAQTASSSNASRDNRGGGGDRGGDRGATARGGFGGGGGGDPRSFFTRRDPGNGAETPDRDGSTSPSNATVDARKSYRVKSVTERLPKGLPEWFARSDANADGQVSMAEFSTSWSDSTLREFQQFDLNNDGVITPSEALSAVKIGAVRGSTSSPASTTTASSTTASRPATTSSGGGSEAPKIDSRYADYYQKLLSRYDTDGDGVLVADEWKAMSKDPSAADTDGDGRITVNELAAWSMKR